MNFRFTLRKYIFLASLLMCWVGANAATVTSTAIGGGWSADTTWVGGTAPLTTDDVVIAAGATVILTAATTVNDLTIDVGGVFDYDGFTLTLNGTVTPTFVSQASGNWTDNGTWLGSPAATPTTGDEVIICRDHTVKLTGATAVTNFTIDDGGIFDYDGNTITVSGTLTPAFVSQASGDWTVSATWLGSPAATPTTGDKVIICRDHTITSGNVAVATLIINSGGTYDDGNNTLAISSKFVLHGERQGTGSTRLLNGASLEGTGYHYSSGDLEIASGALVTIAAGTDIFIANFFTLAGGDARVNNFGKIRALDVKNTGTAFWVNEPNSWLTTLESIGPTLDASAEGNTIAYTKEFDQLIENPTASTYYNLVIGGSEDKTLPGDIIVLGNLFIYSNLVLYNEDLEVGGDWINSGVFTASTGTTVTFNGTTDQSITNTSSETFYNLIVNKSSGDLILNDDVSVTNILNMSSGNINTGTNIITLGTSAGSVGSLSHTTGSIIGSFERWIAAGTNAKLLFPVGTASLYIPAEPTFSDAANTGGSVIVSFVEASPGNEGLSLDDGGTIVYNTFVEGYWDVTAANSFVPSDFDLDLTATGMTSFALNDNTRLLKRKNSKSDWVAEGTHGVRSGDIVKRTLLDTLSAQYALADITNCTPPVTYAITGAQDVLTGQANVTYSVVVNTGNTYYWSVTGGTIDPPASGLNVNSITIDWGSTGQIGEVSVYETNTCTQSEEVSLPVNIHTLPTSDISGSIQVAENQTDVAYSVESNGGYTYTWTIDGGVQSSGGTTNSIMVDWGEANAGSVSVAASYPGAADATAVSLEVDIYANILSIATGPWNDQNTWDCNCEPSDYQSVSIQSGHRVTLIASVSIQNISVAGGAVLDQAAKYLTIQGNLILNGVITGTGAKTLTFAGGAGLKIDGTGSINNSTGTSLDITGEANISNSADLLILGDVDITDKRIVTNYGNVELNGNLIGGPNCIWLNGTGSNLTTQGSLFSSGGVLVASATGNTVEYATTTGDGVIATPLQSKYYNLVLSGSVDKETSGDLTIMGDFTISSGILNLDGAIPGYDLTLEGNWLNKGNFTTDDQKVTFTGSNNQTISYLYGAETFYDLAINKSSGNVVLEDEVIVSNELTMTRGDIDASANKITLGTSAANEGTLSYTDGVIIGEFERWLAASTTIDPLLFPVGTAGSYRSMKPTFTNNAAGTLSAKFVETNPGSNGLSQNDVNPITKRIFNAFVEGYWEFTAGNSFDDVSTYDLELTGNDFSSYPIVDSTRLLIRDQASSAWDFEGAHAAAVGTIVKRTGMTTLSAQYAFGSTKECTPPAAPTFTGVTDVCKGDNGDVYTITSSTAGITDYTWTVAGGSIAAGQGTTSVTINWENSAQVGSVGLAVNNGCTVSDETLLAVNVHTMVPASITGSLIVPASTGGYVYSVENTPDYTYSWTINGGTITPPPSTYTITVDWGTTGIGQLSVTAQNTTLSCPVTEVVSIDVYKYVVIKSNVASGTWDDPNAWDCLCKPVAGDNPMILNGHTITMNADATVEHLNVNIGGELIANSGGDLDLVVTGNLIVDGEIKVTSLGNILNLQLTEGAGFDLGGIGTINPSIAGTEGILVVSRGSCTITSTSLLKINDVDMTIDPIYVSVDNYGSIALSQDLISTNANFTWINQTNSMLKVEGELLAAASLNTSAVGNTVYYSDSTGTQNIKIPVGDTYHNLSVGGLGTKTMQKNTVVEGNLTITDAGILDVTATPFSLSVAENWTNNSIAADGFLEQTGTVTLNGSTAQTITGTETFYGLTLNNSLAGDAITLAGDITITNSFTLTDGQMVNASNTITLDAGVDATVTVSAPTADSFVDGPLINVVSSTSPQTVIFPIGKGDALHIAELNVTNDAATSTSYTAEFFDSAPSTFTLPGAINHVSGLGYWDIDKGAGAGVTSASVNLSYLASDAVDTPADLRLVKDDGTTNWIDLGGTGTGPTTGTILSTNNFTTFSQFALASASAMNPLPVTLLDFYAVTEDMKVMLNWSTTSELNNDFFTLEKSKNGSDFVKLGEVAGNGTTNLQMDYSFTDQSPYLGLSYYRLSQTDYDGTTEVFPVLSVLVEGKSGFSIGPNPVAGTTMLLKISKKGDYEDLELSIIDLQGRLVERKHLMTDGFGNLDTVIQLKMPLQKGVYIFELSSVNSKERIKVAAH